MLEITKDINEATFITHANTFHPDDVFSAAFLSKLYPNKKIIRVNKVDNYREDQIVFDIGYTKFDHHGKDALWRNEKIKYSSFGLLWKEYGKDYLKTITKYYEEIFTRVDKLLVEQIDGIDNGNFPTIIADYSLLDLDHIIDLYNNEWDSKIDNDINFIKAVELASIIIDNIIKREIAEYKAFNIVTKTINNTDSNILYLEEKLPYIDAIYDNNFDSKFNAVIYPSDRGGYCIKPLTINKNNRELKVNFPKEWWGLHDEELAKISGIKTATFIHSTGFLATTITKEDAYLMAQQLK